MKTTLERVLVVQPHDELRAYTSALLSDLGFRHVLQAPGLSQALLILDKAKANRQTIQLILCDDTLPEGALELHQRAKHIPCTVISDPDNPRNLRLAAGLGLKALLFRPYGKAQLLRTISDILLS